jgi:hypothetical protein
VWKNHTYRATIPYGVSEHDVLISLLFGKAKSTINEHIQNIYQEGELEKDGTLQKFGNSEFQQKAPNYYNLDVIISG